MINVKLAATLMVALMMFSGAAVMVGTEDNDATDTTYCLTATGANSYGQLGLGDTDNRNTWTQTAASLGSIKKVITNGGASFVILQNGSVYASGNNANGRLGLGDTDNRNTWTQTAASLGPVKDITVSTTGTSYLLLEDGSLYVAGINTDGQMGLGNSTSQTSWTQTAASLGPVKSVTVNNETNNTSAYLLLEDGSLYVAGYYGQGRFGYNYQTNRTSWTQTADTLGAVKSVVVNNDPSCSVFIVLQNGSVYATGNNSNGQLGLGDTTLRTSWTQTAGTLGSVDSVYTSTSHSFLILEDGSVYGCGYNGKGELGLGDTTSRDSWTQTAGTLGKPELINMAKTPSGTAVFMKLVDGSVYVSGYNSTGCFGTGTSNNTVSSWTQTAASLGPVKSVQTSVYSSNVSSFLILEDGSVYAAGYNTSGQLGVGGTSNKTSWTQPASFNGTGVSIALGPAYTFLVYVPPTVTASFAANDDNYGSVSDASIADIEPGTTATISGNTITIGETTVTATPASADPQYTYAFSKWQVSGTDVTGTYTLDADTTFTAVFTATTNQYAVTIAPNDPTYGSISPSSLTVDYGTAITVDGTNLSIGAQAITATPTTADAQYTYAFSSWSVPDAAETVTGNITITGTFTATVNTYTVTIESADDTLGTVSPTTVSDVPYGTAITVDGDTITIGETVITATVIGDGLVTKWSVSDGATVQGDITITASFIEPSNAENSLLKLIPFLLVMVLVVTAVGGLVATGGNPESLVRFIIMLAVGVLVVAVFVLPILEGL